MRYHNLNTIISLPYPSNSNNYVLRFLDYFLASFLFIIILVRYNTRLLFSITLWDISILFNFYAKILGVKRITELSLVGSDDPLTLSIHNTFYNKLKLYQLKVANHIYCVSTALYNTCIEFGFEEKKLTKKINSPDSNIFYYVNQKRQFEIRESLNISENKIVLICIGRICSRKNQLYLLDILQYLPSNYLLLLVGPGDKEYIDSIRRKMKHDNINNVIIVDKLITDVQLYMMASDIFVFSSNREGFGTVMVEALMCGIPIVSLYLKNISEDIFLHPSFGTFLHDKSPHNFAKNVKKFHNNKCETISFKAKSIFSAEVNDFNYSMLLN